MYPTKRIQHRALALGAALILSQASQAETRSHGFEARSLYGQTSRFWDTIDGFNGSSNDFLALDQLLNDHYGETAEGLANGKLLYFSSLESQLKDYFSAAYFGLGGDFLDGGEARNRVLPEFKGYQIYTGHLDFGLRQDSSKTESGWGSRIGSTAGAGKQKLVQAYISDFQPKPPIENAAVFYFGLDLDLNSHATLGSDLETNFDANFLPTYFYSDLSHSAYQYQVRESEVRLRWKLKDEWVQGFRSAPGAAGAELGVHAIAGQQPTPVEFLPRTWDSVHDIAFFPSPAALIGLGTQARVFSNREWAQLKISGGLYGGYLGAGAQGTIGHLVLTAATYGLETSKSYRTQESRIKFLSLEWIHAL